MAVVGWAIVLSVVTYLQVGEAGELIGPRLTQLYFSWLPVGLGLVTFHLGRRLLERVNQLGAFAPTAVAATLICALTIGFVGGAYRSELGPAVIVIGIVLIVAAIQARTQSHMPAAAAMRHLDDAARALRLAGMTLLVGWGAALAVAAVLMLAVLDPSAYFIGSAALLVMACISIWYAAGLVRDEAIVLRIAAASAGVVPSALLVMLADVELALAAVVLVLAATLVIAAIVTLLRVASAP